MDDFSDDIYKFKDVATLLLKLSVCGDMWE